MKIAYCPFNDDDTVNAIIANIRNFHRGLFSSFLEKYDLRVRVHRGDGRQVLRDVKFDQQVYIFGHGAEGSDEIEAMDGSTLTLAELAEQLFMDGLSMSQKAIKLFSCEGGRGGNNSMAAKLKLHLQQWGYRDIAVYGYTESLAIGTQGVVGQKYSSDTGKRAKSVRVKF
jgi:hypothetical protein